MIKRLCYLLPLLLLACAGLTDPLHGKPVPTDETPAQKALREAHSAIDEANAALIALNRTISNNVKSQVWTRLQAQAYLDQSVEYGSKLDKAKNLLLLGNIADAKQQAAAIKLLILELHKEVAAKAGKETKWLPSSYPPALQSSLI
jgi:soluble cytochrome b562